MDDLYSPQGIDLDIFLELLNKAHRYENYVHACCPFHDDKNPSFFVYQDRYNCKSCGKFGKTSKLLKFLKGVTSTVTVQVEKEDFYNPWSGWLKKQSLKAIVSSAYKRQSVYMRNRGIPDHVQKELGIGLRDNWVIIPIIDQNRHIQGAVSRAGDGNNSPVRYYIPSNQDPNLVYAPSWRKIEKADFIYLTFGMIDAISLYLLGFASMSTSTGKRIDSSALVTVRKEIRIIPDFGEEAEAIRLAKELGWRGKVHKIEYPFGCKDINEWLGADRKSLEELLRS